jgi:hypothetical protein
MQHVPLALEFIPTSRSQAVCWPSGSVTAKFTVIVLPAGASVGVTVNDPDGGKPAFDAADTVMYWRA